MRFFFSDQRIVLINEDKVIRRSISYKRWCLNRLNPDPSEFSEAFPGQLLAAAHPSWGFPAVHGPQGQVPAAAQLHQVGDWGLWSLWSPEKAADEISGCFVPACWIIYIEEKVMQPQKTPKHGKLAPSELSEPIPLFFSIAMKALPCSHCAPRAARGRWWCSTAAVLLRRLYAAPAQQPSKTRLQAKKYVWGGFKEAAGCYARWPRSLWCNYPSRLVFQTCFVKLLRFLLTSSNANNFPLFHHIYHVLNSIRSMQMITEGISVLLASSQHSRKKISM